jgi:hypothetical protein
MAKDKKAVLIYSNWEQTFENLSDEEAGRLIKHLFRYVNDKNPIAPDRITELIFEPIKAVLKSDLEKYEKVKNDKSIQGRLGNLKRWNNDLFLKVESQTLSLEQAEIIAKQRKLSVSDEIIANATKPSLKIAVNDNVNDNVNDILLSENEFLELFNKCRNHFDKLKTNLETLQVSERMLLKNVKKPKQYFIDALSGMFTQKNMYPMNRLRPKHFLENIEQYYECHHNKTQLFKDKDTKTDKL